jgi:hypothetical protein
MDFTERDFFVRIRQGIRLKMELQTQYPDIFKFLEEAAFEDSPEMKAELGKKIKELSDINFGKIYEGIDFSKFRDDMDIQKVLKIITSTFEKLSEEEFAKAKLSPTHHFDYKQIQIEVEEYFELLTKAFYK